MSESSDSFDYGDGLKELYKKKRKVTYDLDGAGTISDEESSRDFGKLPQEAFTQPAKKVQFLKPQNERVYRPMVDLDDDDKDSLSDDEDDYLDPDPAYKINEKALRAYKRRREESDETEKLYNIFRLARLNDRKAKIIEATNDPKKFSTPQEKRSKNLISLKEAGKPMRDEYVDLDSDNVIYLPCKPPDMTEVDNILGPSMPTGTACFACTHGVGFPMMNGKLVEHLERFIREVVPNADPILVAIKISHYYATKIQAPTNRNLKGERPLPNWTARQVYDCLTKHRIEPSHWLYNTIRQLQTHREAIRQIGLYRFDAQIVKEGSLPMERDMVISRYYNDMYLKIIDMELKLLKQDPKKMLGHNEKISIASTVGTIIGPKTNLFHQQKITDIFQSLK